MAKDDKKPDEEAEQQEEPVRYRIKHTMNAGEVIALRKNIQRKLNERPGEHKISLDLVVKEEDNGVYFTATPTEAEDILTKFRKKARAWQYGDVTINVEELEAEPEGILSAEDLERIEANLSEGLREELSRLYVEIGSLSTDLSRAKEDLAGLHARAIAAEASGLEMGSKITQLEGMIESLKGLKETLAKGTLADACIQFIHARAENVEILEMLLADIQESGLDVGFISNPPESVERYAREKLMRALNVEYRDLERCLEIGEADTWEESRLHMPKEEMDEAAEKLDKLTKTITSADESIKAILEENLGAVLGNFNATVQEYTSKQERYRQARQTYLEHRKAVEQGTDELARAKELKTSLADLRKMKFPVYAVPEQDGATVYLPVASGISYDSIIAAIKKVQAQIKSEEEIGGNTVLRIGGDGEWNPLQVLKSIKDAYEQNTEAGKMGSKLGLLVQF
ncbi:hypothetical protein KY338_03835 [Candidatus Woesearchaeota archaeon]|nr:hypothetical protein [Candidatus Woesearchaeota archaeon]MBW3005443.1 hypothetical protein [Candidatus Woesearchaeota archaeon]